MVTPEKKQAAMEAVLGACRLCIRVAASLSAADTLQKQDRTPVTVADFGSQAVVATHLVRALGPLTLVGEEDAATLQQDPLLRSSVVRQVQQVYPDLSEAQVLAAVDRGSAAGGGAESFWTLDPIDGTKGFLRGDQYAVALALIERGQVVLGVLGCPSLPLSLHGPVGGRGCLLVACRGEGTSMRSLDRPELSPVRVADAKDPSRAAFCESLEPEHSSHELSARVALDLGLVAPPIRMDSQCKYGIVARGEASIYMRIPRRPGYEEKIWDHAAGSILVQEAGGQVTDIDGRPLDFTRGRTLRCNRGVLATGGDLHDGALAAIGRQVQTR